MNLAILNLQKMKLLSAQVQITNNDHVKVLLFGCQRLKPATIMTSISTVCLASSLLYAYAEETVSIVYSY